MLLLSRQRGKGSSCSPLARPARDLFHCSCSSYSYAPLPVLSSLCAWVCCGFARARLSPTLALLVAKPATPLPLLRSFALLNWTQAHLIVGLCSADWLGQLVHPQQGMQGMQIELEDCLLPLILCADPDRSTCFAVLLAICTYINKREPQALQVRAKAALALQQRLLFLQA